MPVPLHAQQHRCLKGFRGSLLAHFTAQGFYYKGIQDVHRSSLSHRQTETNQGWEESSRLPNVWARTGSCSVWTYPHPPPTHIEHGLSEATLSLTVNGALSSE